jgi:hypothetical protein
VGPGSPIGGRRALVEAPDIRPLALGDGAVKHIAVAPALEDPILELRERLLRVYGPEGHRLILPTGRGLSVPAIASLVAWRR